MNKDTKGLLKSLLIIFIGVLLLYPLPHDSYTLIQYIIPPIRFENSVLNLAALFPIVMIIMGIRGLFRLERYANKSKIMITIIVLLLVIPFMRSSLGIVKSIYLSNLPGELTALDLVEAKVSIGEITDTGAKIKVDLVLLSCDNEIKEFKVKMHMPESLKPYFHANHINFKESYRALGRNNRINISEEKHLKLVDGVTVSDVLDSLWFWETYYFDLYNENESLRLIYHGH